MPYDYDFKGRVARSQGPAWKALEKDWNALHDMEYALGHASHEYDVASSYRGTSAERDSKYMVQLINETQKAIKALSVKFDNLTSFERKYIKNHGTPDEVATRERAAMFPR